MAEPAGPTSSSLQTSPTPPGDRSRRPAIELNVSDKPQLDSFALHVRAADQAAAKSSRNSSTDSTSGHSTPKGDTGLFSVH
ncbi:hypothetical protein [Kribbella sp. CA-294648]|uniref:hypothetical protein n=1 Tax=Kribbella sp. CA-294648 TaxID=3239948 RepID=UPI003D8A38F2